MTILGIIPARYASSRFPGKPLALIAGKSLIQRVVEQCRESKSLSEVIVATDDVRIAEVAGKFCRVEMTRADHPSGSDRIAEAAERCECDAVVNIQGDEPLIDPGERTVGGVSFFHLGIYGYQRETLLRLVKSPVSPLENAEKLEQLRALENGTQIAVVKVRYDSVGVGVDVPEDVARVKAWLSM